MSAGKENVPSHSRVDDLKNKILANDTQKVWDCLQEANKSHKVHIHLILDNAGFELFSDFCLLHFLLSAKLVSKVSLHVKEMGWFVSDTLDKDIDCLLEALTKSDCDVLANLGKQWTDNFTKGSWQIEKELFWTLPHDYSQMPKTDPNLYKKLSNSDLLIFKGDLNYRKLTADRQWEETTAFRTAVTEFLPTSLVALRSIKSDTVVGIPSGTTDRLDSVSSSWKFSGDYAVIEYAKKEE